MQAASHIERDCSTQSADQCLKSSSNCFRTCPCFLLLQLRWSHNLLYFSIYHAHFTSSCIPSIFGLVTNNRAPVEQKTSLQGSNRTSSTAATINILHGSVRTVYVQKYCTLHACHLFRPSSGIVQAPLMSPLFPLSWQHICAFYSSFVRMLVQYFCDRLACNVKILRYQGI